MPQKMMDNLEIVLTFAGLGVIFMMAGLLHAFDYWHVIAVTAMAVGVVHGLLFWYVRRRQRLVRRELISAMRPMLADRIKNPLAVLLMAVTEGEANDRTNEEREVVVAALSAARDISATLDLLSLDSLHKWQHQY